MLQLYFFPMACSLASRIALTEAGVEAQYLLAHIWTKTVVDDGSDFLGVSPKGAVPVLVLENGERLTESAAVLQYIADLKPEAGLAPRFGDPDRYRLQEWLSFIGAEIHKAFPVSDLLVQGRRLARQAAGKDYTDIVGASHASGGPRIPDR
ncbi:glutathione S-transferase [Bradyrhizobium sp. LM3.2]